MPVSQMSVSTPRMAKGQPPPVAGEAGLVERALRYWQLTRVALSVDFHESVLGQRSGHVRQSSFVRNAEMGGTGDPVGFEAVEDRKRHAVLVQDGPNQARLAGRLEGLAPGHHLVEGASDYSPLQSRDSRPCPGPRTQECIQSAI
jgi:hypothetical protein